MKTNDFKQTKADQDQLLTEKQAAYVFNCSVALLRERRQQAALPIYVKMGKMVRYRRQDLQDHIDASVFPVAVAVWREVKPS